MVEYRISLSRKPTIRLYKLEGNNRKYLAEVTGKKAELAKNILLNDLNLKEKIRFRDGRIVTEADEDTALKVMIGLRSIIGLRDRNRITKIIEAVKSMDKGEVWWWHSLCLKVGEKGIRALRSAYI